MNLNAEFEHLFTYSHTQTDITDKKPKKCCGCPDLDLFDV